MMKDKLFIFDANIIISAVLLPESKPDLAIRKAQNSGNILMSPEIWAELEQVLARPKVDRYISSEDRSKFLQDFFDTVILVMDLPLFFISSVGGEVVASPCCQGVIVFGGGLPEFDLSPIPSPARRGGWSNNKYHKPIA